MFPASTLPKDSPAAIHCHPATITTLAWATRERLTASGSKGRGFVQLTGRAAYRQQGDAMGAGGQLIEHPELANDPEVAALILATFLKRRENASAPAWPPAISRPLPQSGQRRQPRHRSLYRGLSNRPAAVDPVPDEAPVNA